MDTSTARRVLNSQLTSLAQRRARAQREIDDAGLEIGATSTYLRDVLGQPKARSAEFAGLSPSHLTELMQTALEKGVTIADPLRRVPFLHGVELQEFVNARGGPQRIIASFSDLDAMYMAGLSPETFLDRDFGFGLRLPQMLILTRDGDWVAVHNVTVGYTGTGPSNARRELGGLGIPPDLIDLIVRSRVSDVDLDHPDQGLHTHQWPHVPLGPPWPVDDFFVSVVHVENELFTRSARDFHIGPPDGQTYGGFYPSPPTEPPLTSWLKALDSPTKPEWMSGPRRARVYLDRSLARAHGFTLATLQPGSNQYVVYPVILEQGRLQLWLNIPTSNDPTVLFTPEIYDALDQAGFYTGEQRTKDAQSSFWRWLRSLGTQRPGVVDLNDEPLRHMPKTT